MSPIVRRAVHEARVAARAVARATGAEKALDRRLERRRREAAYAAEGEWHEPLRRLLRDGVTVPTAGSWGEDDRGSVPIVICLWNRPERIHDIVTMLEGLDEEHPVRVLFWNNDPTNAPQYEWLVDHRPTGALTSIDLFDSPENIGGIARFVAMRLLRNSGYEGPVILLDDDQDVAPSFVADLARDYEEHRIVAWWAFDFGPSYWDRRQIPVGSLAEHGGTGGTMLDSTLVDDDRFFDDLPKRYGFLEDQWMSHFAKLRDWTIVKATTQIEFVLEHTNQYHALIGLKDEFHWSLEAENARLGAPQPYDRAGWRGRGRIRGAR